MLAEEDHYNKANVKIVAEVRKHRTKGPPPIPTNDAELLRLNTRDVTVLTAFFTKWSMLMQQETELNKGIQEQQMDMFSHPDSTWEMIPQFLWANREKQDGSILIELFWFLYVALHPHSALFCPVAFGFHMLNKR